MQEKQYEKHIMLKCSIHFGFSNYTFEFWKDPQNKGKFSSDLYDFLSLRSSAGKFSGISATVLREEIIPTTETACRESILKLSQKTNGDYYTTVGLLFIFNRTL